MSVIDPQDLAQLRAHYPALQAIAEAELAQVLAEHAQPFSAPAGALLFDEGSACQGFPMLLQGSVRVARGAPDGRQLELYRIVPGELCVVSTACVFGAAPLSAHAQVVEHARGLLLSAAGLHRWCAVEAFRAYVFSVFGERMAELMALAEAVAFQRLDQRLAQALLGHGPVLCTTHQALADSLGTVREIVSRLLARFERAGWVCLGRERIELLDSAALRALAAGQGPEPGAPR